MPLLPWLPPGLALPLLLLVLVEGSPLLPLLVTLGGAPLPPASVTAARSVVAVEASLDGRRAATLRFEALNGLGGWRVACLVRGVFGALHMLTFMIAVSIW